MLLAIDTSCYTTSWALVAQNGQVIATAQKLLEVPEGGRGLAPVSYTHLDVYKRQSQYCFTVIWYCRSGSQRGSRTYERFSLCSFAFTDDITGCDGWIDLY